MNMKQQRMLLEGTLHIQQAKPEQTEAIQQLLVDTAKWFKEKGSTQWNGLLEGIDSHNTPEAIKRGDVYVVQAQDNETLLGMVMLLQKPSEWDQDLWQIDEPEEDKSVYLHRLAVNRRIATNKGLGHAILKWCQANYQFGTHENLRLDCVADNTFLNQFYTNNGFQYKGQHEGYSLYEYRDEKH